MFQMLWQRMLLALVSFFIVVTSASSSILSSSSSSSSLSISRLSHLQCQRIASFTTPPQCTSKRQRPSKNRTFSSSSSLINLLFGGEADWNDQSFPCRFRQDDETTRNRIPPPPLHRTKRTIHDSAPCSNDNWSIDNNEYDRDAIHAFLSKELNLHPTTTSNTIHCSSILNQEQIRQVTNLVQNRSEARRKRDYQLADCLRDEICSWTPFRRRRRGRQEYPEETSEASEGEWPYQVQLRDVPRHLGGGSTWELVSVSGKDGPKDDTAVGAAGGGGKFASASTSDNDRDDESTTETNTATALGLARLAMELTKSASERGGAADRLVLETLVRRAKNRIWQTKASELGGRKAADCAFWFALAGVNDSAPSSPPPPSPMQMQMQTSTDPFSTYQNLSIYTILTYISVEELLRFGTRPSCRSKDILHIVERIAAAGVVGPPMDALLTVAAQCLRSKRKRHENENDETRIDTNGAMINVEKEIREKTFGLHSDRPLLLLWRLAARQKKQRSHPPSSPQSPPQPQSLQQDWNWNKMFHNPNLPLVVDVGCGMGTSLLGLASQHLVSKSSSMSSAPSSSVYPPPPPLANMDWSSCNYLGGDLSNLGIAYASSVADRWGLLGDRLAVCVSSAEELLAKVVRSKNGYPGPVWLIMIQFPTPFRLVSGGDEDEDGEDEEDSSWRMPATSTANDDDVGDDNDPNLQQQQQQQQQGNAQLPTNPFNGFMVTDTLLQLARSALDESSGYLLLQSNCEDVAVWMKDLATEQRVGFRAISCVPHAVVRSLDVDVDGNAKQERITRRTARWISMLDGDGDGMEMEGRAVGEDWSAVPLLPRRGATETEISCLLNETPVHRCVLSPRK